MDGDAYATDGVAELYLVEPLISRLRSGSCLPLREGGGNGM